MLSVNFRKRFENGRAHSFELQVQESFYAGFTVLFGPSGAGKSTLLDCIAGLVEPNEGSIKLDDRSFFGSGLKVSLPPQQRGVGYVFQSLALFPHLTAEQNVEYGLFGLKAAERRDRMQRALESFHISKLRCRRPAELSGGEKQRVALARSVVTQPRVLLLDEPLTGLDAGLRQAILEDLRVWNAVHRIPILYVTHNREELDAIGERVVTMLDGKTRESGMPGEVLDAPRALGLAQAAGFENVLTARVTEHRPDDGVMRVALAADHCELEIPLVSAQPGETIRVAIRAGDILLAAERPRGLSARNVLEGTVEALQARGSLVAVRVNAGVEFTVHVTPGAVRSLQLRRGLVLWLVVKTHSCHVVAPH